MPRKAPTEVIEQRIALGSWERQYVAQQTDYVRSQISQAKFSIVAMPIAVTIGAATIGYGAYAGMCAIAGVIPSLPDNVFKENGTFNWIGATWRDDPNDPDNQRNDQGSWFGALLRITGL